MFAHLRHGTRTRTQRTERMFAFLALIVCAALFCVSDATRVMRRGVVPVPVPANKGKIADLRAALKLAGCDTNCQDLDQIQCPAAAATFGPQSLSYVSCDANSLVTELSLQSVADLTADLDIGALEALQVLVVNDAPSLQNLILAAGHVNLRTMALNGVPALQKLDNLASSYRLESLSITNATLTTLDLPATLQDLTLVSCVHVASLDFNQTTFLTSLLLDTMPISVVNVTGLPLETLSISVTRPLHIVGLDTLAVLRQFRLFSIDLQAADNVLQALSNSIKLTTLDLKFLPAVQNLDVSWFPMLQSLSIVNLHNLANLTGIEDVTMLTDLHIEDTYLATLNVTMLPLLSTLIVVGNRRMEKIYAQDLPLLQAIKFGTTDYTKELYFINVGLTEIILDNQYNLEFIQATNNSLLTQLSLTRLSLLELIHVESNPVLSKMSVSMCGLSELDVSANVALEELVIYGNGALGIVSAPRDSLVRLDVTLNTALKTVDLPSVKSTQPSPLADIRIVDNPLLNDARFLYDLPNVQSLIMTENFKLRATVGFLNGMTQLMELNITNNAFIGPLPATLNTPNLLTCVFGSDITDANCFSTRTCPTVTGSIFNTTCDCGGVLNCVISYTTVATSAPVTTSSTEPISTSTVTTISKTTKSTLTTPTTTATGTTNTDDTTEPTAITTDTDTDTVSSVPVATPKSSSIKNILSSAFVIVAAAAVFSL